MTYSQLLEGQLVFVHFSMREWKGPNMFSYNNEILFKKKKKRILCGNEWDNDKNKQIIKNSKPKHISWPPDPQSVLQDHNLHIVDLMLVFFHLSHNFLLSPQLCLQNDCFALSVLSLWVWGWVNFNDGLPIL